MCWMKNQGEYKKRYAVLLCILLGALGCATDRNIEPVLTTPERVFFSVGIENQLTLFAADSDGDDLRFDFRFKEESMQAETVGIASLVPVSGGAVFTWTLGMDAASLVGQSLTVEFSAEDGRGGRTVSTSELLIVDPYRFGTKALRLSRSMPDGYLSPSRCIQPVDFGVVAIGLGSELTSFSIRHAPLECPAGEGCLPALEILSTSERRLTWCATQALLRRSLDHEFEVQVGVASGVISFVVPLQFRFVDDADSSCSFDNQPRFEVIESRLFQNMFEVRVAISGGPVVNPMVSVLSGGASSSNLESLGGLGTYNLTHIGGDQWRARFAAPFQFNSGDSVNLLFSSLQTGTDCTGVFLSQVDDVRVITPTQERTTNGDVCAACLEDSDCINGRCLVFDGQGRCGLNCRMHSDCSTGNLCVTTEAIDGGQFAQCLPESGSCNVRCSNRVAGTNTGGEVVLGPEDSMRQESCVGMEDNFTIELNAGEGVRVSVSPDRIAERPALPALSVSMAGEDAWDVWHSVSTTVYELPCALEPLRLSARVWSWWGSGTYTLTTERLVGGCVSACSDDHLETEQEPTLVEEPTRFEGLTLCELDSDAFDLRDESDQGWSVRVEGLPQGKRVRLRVLSLPSLELLTDARFNQSDGDIAISLAGRQVRLVISNGQQGSIPTYSISFDRAGSTDSN